MYLMQRRCLENKRVAGTEAKVIIFMHPKYCLEYKIKAKTLEFFEVFIGKLLFKRQANPSFSILNLSKHGSRDHEIATEK
jgi:hypothetical protein